MYNKEKYKLKSVVPIDFLSENIKKMSIEESALYHINDIYSEYNFIHRFLKIHNLEKISFFNFRLITKSATLKIEGLPRIYIPCNPNTNSIKFEDGTVMKLDSAVVFEPQTISLQIEQDLWLLSMEVFLEKFSNCRLLKKYNIKTAFLHLI